MCSAWAAILVDLIMLIMEDGLFSGTFFLGIASVLNGFFAFLLGGKEKHYIWKEKELNIAGKVTQLENLT